MVLLGAAREENTCWKYFPFYAFLEHEASIRQSPASQFELFHGQKTLSNEEETTQKFLLNHELASCYGGLEHGFVLFGLNWVLPQFVLHLLYTWLFLGLQGRNTCWKYFPLGNFWALCEKETGGVLKMYILLLGDLSARFL